MYRSSGGDHYEQLETFIDQGYIEEILGLVKTGKEASVYVCAGGPAAAAGLVAAKVYRGRQYRFKNDAIYQQSRSRELGIRGRDLRAMKTKGSSFGKEMSEGTWRYREYETLQRLHAAGADVPRPIAAEGDVILIEYLGDEDEPAPQLNRAGFAVSEAQGLFERVMTNIELFLRHDRIHGDLSPHNILYWQGRVTIIDFPQAIDPRFNPNARELLFRDVEHVCRFFEGHGVQAEAWRIADDLWRRFTFARL